MVLKAVNRLDQKIIFTIVERSDDADVAKYLLGNELMVVLVLVQRDKLCCQTQKSDAFLPQALA